MNNAFLSAKKKRCVSKMKLITFDFGKKILFGHHKTSWQDSKNVWWCCLAEAPHLLRLIRLICSLICLSTWLSSCFVWWHLIALYICRETAQYNEVLTSVFHCENGGLKIILCAALLSPNMTGWIVTKETCFVLYDQSILFYKWSDLSKCFWCWVQERRWLKYSSTLIVFCVTFVHAVFGSSCCYFQLTAGFSLTFHIISLVRKSKGVIKSSMVHLSRDYLNLHIIEPLVLTRMFKIFAMAL